MKSKTNLQPEDIARRLLIKRPIWFKGKPTISINGDDKSFGKLIFDFHDGIVEFNLYIRNRQELLQIAQNAIDNFGQLCQDIMEVKKDHKRPVRFRLS